MNGRAAVVVVVTNHLEHFDTRVMYGPFTDPLDPRIDEIVSRASDLGWASVDVLPIYDPELVLPIAP